MRIETEKIKPEEFWSVTVAAGEAAMKELEADRHSVILMEDSLGCAALDMGVPPFGIYLRFDSCKNGLMSLSVDTLILVCPSKLKNAEFAAEHMLVSALHPKIIEIGI